MTMSYGDHDERFIEDIRPPDDGDGFNTRQAHVRHQAIGALEERYLRQHSFGGHAAMSNDEAGAPLASAFPYTRVPPLVLLDSTGASFIAPASTVVRDAAVHAWRPVRRWAVALGIGAAALAASTWRDIRSIHLPHIARKYSVTRGVYIDWLEERRLWQLKWAFFPLAAALALFLIVVPLEISTHTNAPIGTTPKQQARGNAQTFNPASSGNNSTASSHTSSGRPGTSASAVPTASAGTVSSSSGSAAATTNNGGNTTPTSTTSVGLGGGNTAGTVTVPISSGSTSPTPPPTATTSTGTSGGGSGSPTSSTPTSSSTPLPVLNSTSTVSVPPLSASAGGKQLVSTSGTNLTLN